MSALPKIQIGSDINYIAAYLNGFDDPISGSGARSEISAAQFMTPAQWTSALDRISASDGAPVTIINDGSELHPEFALIASSLRSGTPVDLVASLQIDPDTFIKETPLGCFANIYAVYSPADIKADDAVARAAKLKAAGFNITVIMPMKPRFALYEPEIRYKCDSAGVDFVSIEISVPGGGQRAKQFKWDDCCGAERLKSVLCRTSGILIAPDGNVYRCHANLRERVDSVSHILSPFFPSTKKFLPCGHYGSCDPADVLALPSRKAPASLTVDIIFEAETSEEE